ncbi:multicopper oxidase family protein [Actinomadura nitritigenes]|uniref:Multicopper oxidase domain-containing protein n=1 Tax=Actinomadura nitritigenes TaxID=134602 RepID=A0ABS3R9V5_9ACTN|nr:multicopper oxidase domain-containing protein [Actinomadura nitritigenes]MBO2443013.1 multicopper oxidase domain-containing protein [Actinomadura nitritigenes]
MTPPLKKYVDPLPRPVRAIPDISAYPGADYYELTMRQHEWCFHRDLDPATVWGYWAKNPNDPGKPLGMGYLGPTIGATKNHPTVVKYRNELPVGPHMFQFVLDRIRKGDPQLTPPPYHGMPPLPPGINVWNVVHQHGGFTPPQSDGMPLQWFSPEGVRGPSYTTLDPGKVAANEAIYAYTNRERSAMLWYHDHAMGITSLNVYAGLAGLWLVEDPADERLGLPRGEFEVPLILQDRTFDEDGSLAYTMTQVEGADTPVVNGKAYPFLAVQPRRYRLRFLNGSNERFWRLRFQADRTLVPQEFLPFWLIGTDGGLRSPLQMLNFLISPAERYDVIIDFSGLPTGAKVTLMNYNAPVHFPGGGGPEISEIMQFRVTERMSGGEDPTTPPKELALPPVELIRPRPGTRRREWVVYQKGIFESMTFNGVPFMAPSEDFIKEGSSEIWEYINPNHDAHPMHVHLINFQVLNRQPIDATAYQNAFQKWLDGGRKAADRPVLEHYVTGPPSPPDPDEAHSWKDTVRIYPESVTRIIIDEFDLPTRRIASIPASGAELPATYVQHCHILEHEDDDLMRPWTIVADHDRRRPPR